MQAFRLPKDIDAYRSFLAEATNKNSDYHFSQAVIDYLEALVDTHLAEQTLTEIRAGKQKTIPLGAVASRGADEEAFEQ